MNGNDILVLDEDDDRTQSFADPLCCFRQSTLQSRCMAVFHTAILHGFHPQLSLKPLIDSEILIPLMDDLTLDYTKYKLYNNLNFDFRIS